MSIIIIENKNQIIAICNDAKKNGKTIIFVPTMGSLHNGHLSLVAKSLDHIHNKQDAIVIVSIFVNPTQFSENEDYKTYPRTLNDDVSKLNNQGITNYLFLPNFVDLYGSNYNSEFIFSVPHLAKNKLCAKTRPHFFNGVMQVLYRFFMIINPDIVIMGEKDYQQYLVVKSMSQNLFPNIRIKLGNTTRESDGLALSSRNTYLKSDARSQASIIFKSLTFAKKLLVSSDISSSIQIITDFCNKNLSPAKNEKEAIAKLKHIFIKGGRMKTIFYDVIVPLVNEIMFENGFSIDYFEIYNQNDLSHKMLSHENARIFIAVYFNSVRLLDNMPVM